MYIGVLKQGSTAMIEITSSSADRVALTVLKISRDRVSVAETSSVAAGQLQTVATTIGSRDVRVIMLVEPPPGGRASIKVNALSPIQADEDVSLTFDCEP